MNNNPLISVIIPAFNEEKLLPRCLVSLQNQTFKGKYEVIVVDNNSTDKTAHVAKKYGARVVLEPRQGIIPARERGFREARSEIIARTDADSVALPDWLEIIYDTFQKRTDVIAATGPWLSESKKISNKVIGTWTYFYSMKLGKTVSGHPYLLGGNMALRKSAWKKIKVTADDKKVHEDIDLSCNLAKIGKIIYNPKQKTIFSFRRITDNPSKGLKDYLVEYPFRYLKTLFYNLPETKRRKINLFLSKIRKPS